MSQSSYLLNIMNIEKNINQKTITEILEQIGYCSTKKLKYQKRFLLNVLGYPITNNPNQLKYIY